MSNRSGYVIVEIDVRDPKRYEEYAKHSRPAAEAFGGRYRAIGTPVNLEGQQPAARIVVVEFASVPRAQEFYNSEIYQNAKARRQNAADVRMYVVEGIGHKLSDHRP